MSASPRFARLVFLGAALYGIAVLAPQYVLEQKVNTDFPPAITHPEYFYGFVGLALVWQFAFVLIARDVVRFRPLMPIAVLEKLSFGGAAVVLYLLGRLHVQVLAMGVLDLILGALFVVAYLRTPADDAPRPRRA
jgi:hypothetical protein